jgi:hypothetical protein
MVTSSSAGGGRLGRADVQDAKWSLHVAESGENPRFRPLAEAGDGNVSYVLEGIIEVKLQAPSDGSAPTSFPPWGYQSLMCVSTWTSGWLCGGAVFFYSLTTVGLGRVVQRGLGSGRMTMDTRREVASSGAMVVPMAGLTSLIHGSIF